MIYYKNATSCSVLCCTPRLLFSNALIPLQITHTLVLFVFVREELLARVLALVAEVHFILICAVKCGDQYK